MDRQAFTQAFNLGLKQHLEKLAGWKTKAALAGGTLLAANRIGAAQERRKLNNASPYARLTGNI